MSFSRPGANLVARSLSRSSPAIAAPPPTPACATDLLFETRRELGCTQPFEVISGYRCAATNTRLRNSGGGGVARQSLHMEGRAIDIRIDGVPLADVRDAAMSLQAGGVGFYPRSKFVHLDTGKVRYW
ncbi:MAG: DUF882 domain-containing protein [Candidatus Accumulibacter sp.]|nr:DUF882 domain-containing protein [Accumulibacter sp.]